MACFWRKLSEIYMRVKFKVVVIRVICKKRRRNWTPISLEWEIGEKSRQYKFIKSRQFKIPQRISS